MQAALGAARAEAEVAAALEDCAGLAAAAGQCTVALQEAGGARWEASVDLSSGTGHRQLRQALMQLRADGALRKVGTAGKGGCSALFHGHVGALIFLRIQVPDGDPEPSRDAAMDVDEAAPVTALELTSLSFENLNALLKDVMTSGPRRDRTLNLHKVGWVGREFSSDLDLAHC